MTHSPESAANRRGIAADLRIVERTGRVGFYEVYRAHNYHFLAYAAMFTGRADEAMTAARDLVRELPMDTLRELPQFLEAFLAVPYHVLVRFGRWDEMLAEPPPEAWQKSRLAFYQYGRGVALAALGRTAEARAERDAFRAAMAEVPPDWTAGNNPTSTVLAIGDAFLDGDRLRSRSIAAPGRAPRLGFVSCNRSLCTPVRPQSESTSGPLGQAVPVGPTEGWKPRSS